MLQPDYIFETSWEVCNRVGGIYAVLSTRAASMQREHPDRVFFFGPDFGDHSDIYFREDKKLLGKSVKTIYCMPCLADYLGTTVEDLEDKIEEFARSEQFATYTKLFNELGLS